MGGILHITKSSIAIMIFRLKTLKTPKSVLLVNEAVGTTFSSQPLYLALASMKKNRIESSE